MKKCLVIIFPLLLTVFNVKAQVEIVSTGTATAYVVNVPGSFTLRNGLQVTFKAHINCAASPSINVSGTGAIGLRKNGNTTALSAADIIANQIVTIVYDGTFWQMVTNPGTPATAANYWTLNGTHIYNNNSGNIGVGITNPTTAKFQIENSTFNGNLLRLNNLFNSNGASILEVTTNGSGSGVNVNHTGFGPAGQFEIASSGSSSNALRAITNGGNSKALEVLHSGINAGSIDYGIHSTVTGAGNSNTAGYFSATGATTNWAGYFESGNVYIQNSLGLGTITPNNILHLSGSFSSTGMIGSFIDLQNTFGSSTSAAKVGIRFKTSNFPNGQHAKGGIIYSRTSTNARGDIHFLNNSTDDVSEIDISTDTKMIIKNSGDIGIGTSAPTAKLHLEGGRLRIANGSNILDIHQSGTQSLMEASNTFAVAANGGGVKFNMDDGDANFDLAVHVNGLFQIKDGTEGAGKVLTSDGAGNTKWQNPIIFRGLFAPTGALTITATPQIIGGTISYSGSVLYNTSPGGFGGSMTVGNMRFRAPEQGYYQIHANVYVSINPNQNVMIEAYNLTTSSVIASTLVRNPDASAQMFYTMDISTISLLNLSDDVVIRILGGGASSGLIVSNSNYNNFEVNLIR